MDNKCFFTLFVPCYNSSRFIHRVFNSIDNFECRDFELIIVNDASTDNTSELIQNYISKVDFPVDFLDREKNAGLTENYAYALNNAHGKFFCAMGHDDEWDAKTLTVYKGLLEKYDSDDIAGIGCLCTYQNGKLVSPKFKTDLLIDSNLSIYYEKGAIRHEVPINYKTDIYKKMFLKYPKGSNIDTLIGCQYKTIFVNKILRTYYVNENTTALTKRSRITIAPEQVLTGLQFVNEIKGHIKEGSNMAIFKRIFGYVYYANILHLPFREIVLKINKWYDKIIVIILLPFAWILSLIKK